MTLQGAAGAYKVTSTQSGNQIMAGPGTESFGVTGNAVALTGGAGTDTFTVTSGNHNETFQAG